jgi:hypothetical protein
MSIKVVSNTLSLDDLRMEFRSFKLKCINSEIEFKISDYVVDENKNLLSFITDTFPNDVITGSLALKLLGLISRKSNDVDILIKDKNRYSEYILDGYDDEFATPNRLGYKSFKYKKRCLIGTEKLQLFPKYKEYTVDFFEDKNVNFIEFTIDISTTFHSNIKKIKIHNPLEIMDYKLAIFANTKVVKATGIKHNEDLTTIFGQAPWQVK